MTFERSCPPLPVSSSQDARSSSLPLKTPHEDTTTASSSPFYTPSPAPAPSQTHSQAMRLPAPGPRDSAAPAPYPLLGPRQGAGPASASGQGWAAPSPLRQVVAYRDGGPRITSITTARDEPRAEVASQVAPLSTWASTAGTGTGTSTGTGTGIGTGVTSWRAPAPPSAPARFGHHAVPSSSRPGRSGRIHRTAGPSVSGASGVPSRLAQSEPGPADHRGRPAAYTSARLRQPLGADPPRLQLQPQEPHPQPRLQHQPCHPAPSSHASAPQTPPHLPAAGCTASVPAPAPAPAPASAPTPAPAPAWPGSHGRAIAAQRDFSSEGEVGQHSATLTAQAQAQAPVLPPLELPNPFPPSDVSAPSALASPWPLGSTPTPASALAPASASHLVSGRSLVSIQPSMAISARVGPPGHLVHHDAPRCARARAPTGA